MNIRRTIEVTVKAAAKMTAHVAALGLASAMWVGVAQADEPIVIKFSHVVSVNTPKGKGAEYFKRLVEQQSAGRVKVEVYPNSSLYKDKEELEALQLGAVQMLAPSLSKFGPLGLRQFEVFDLPFLFNDYNELHRVTTGPVGKKLLGLLEQRGLEGLAFWDNGFKVFSANKELRKPEDFKGLKMRIQSSKVLESQMRAVGALPQVMAFSEVYQALQTGVVDGTENPPSNLYTTKMYEVQKYVTANSNHGYLGYAVVTNKKFWDGLPADIRAILEQAMAATTKYVNAIAYQENEAALEEVAKSGKSTMIKLTDSERAGLKRAMVKVHQEHAGRIGKDVVEEVYKAAGFNPKM